MRRKLLGRSLILYKTGYLGALALLMVAVARLAVVLYELSNIWPSRFVMVAAFAGLATALAVSWRPYRFLRSMMFEMRSGDEEAKPDPYRFVKAGVILAGLAAFHALFAFDFPLRGSLRVRRPRSFPCICSGGPRISVP